MTGGMAFALHRSPLMSRIMFANPWVILAIGVGGGFASIYGVRATDPSNHVQKMAFFTLFQASQSIALAPLFFLSPALLARAGLYTMGTVGSLAFVGATAKTDKYLYLGGPLLAGLAVVALSSLAPMVCASLTARAATPLLPKHLR
jgi:FtsH-binding integral membrane protein